MRQIDNSAKSAKIQRNNTTRVRKSVQNLTAELIYKLCTYFRALCIAFLLDLGTFFALSVTWFPFWMYLIFALNVSKIRNWEWYKTLLIDNN